MTLHEAIEILTIWHDDPHQFHNPDYPKAVKLLIEAGKRFNKHSPYPHEYLGGPLPGETKE